MQILYTKALSLVDSKFTEQQKKAHFRDMRQRLEMWI